MKIGKCTANVLALCYYGVNPAKGIAGRKWVGRKKAILQCIDSGLLEPNGHTLTNAGLNILQWHVLRS